MPLEKTIEIILRRIYTDKEINTNIPKREMKELLYLCTKNVHFSYNNEIYIQIDGVAMGSPLGPVLANIFMVELETNIVPKLERDIKLWKRFVDNMFCFAKIESIDFILTKLNSFHTNIKFTMETEQKSTIPFLDVFVVRTPNGIETTAIS